MGGQVARAGYVCAPYLHTHGSVELRESWMASPDVDSLHFVTGTLSGEAKPYFSEAANHYLLARYSDVGAAYRDASGSAQPKTSFVFGVRDDLFSREVPGETNSVSVYYVEYGEDMEDMREIANVLLRREKVSRAGLGDMRTLCTVPPRFEFPYAGSIVVIEVASDKGHQSLNKYCEQTRRDVNRKGLTMTNLMSLSILERLK